MYFTTNDPAYKLSYHPSLKTSMVLVRSFTEGSKHSNDQREFANEKNSFKPLIVHLPPLVYNHHTEAAQTKQLPVSLDKLNDRVSLKSWRHSLNDKHILYYIISWEYLKSVS